MKAVNTLLAAAAGALAALLLAAPLAPAQVKPAGGDEELKNGMRVAVTLKDGKKVIGTYVRSAPGTMYVRTQPGAVPTALRGDDITKTERISPVGGRTGGANQPEIHIVTIHNGPDTTLRYIAPTLSPAEQSRLNEFEAAESEYNRLNSTASLTQEYVRHEQSLEKYRYEAERNYYRFSALAAMGFYPGTGQTPFPNYGYVNFGGSPYFPTSALYSGSGYLSGQYVTGGLGAVPVAPVYTGGSSYPPPPGLAMTNPGIIKTMLAASIAKQASPEALAQAKTNLETARRHLIYEGDRVVAVSIAEPAIKGAGN